MTQPVIKRICIWSPYYAPEQTGIAPFNHDLAVFLQSKGHVVEVITGFPFFPGWRVADSYRGCLFRAETAEGIRVNRCWLYVPRAATSLRRMLHEFSFGMSSLLVALVRPRADIYIVVSPPLTLGFFGWLCATLKRSRFCFHVQDLQPDAAVGMGMLKRGKLVSALYRLESFVYKRACFVSGITNGMVAAFREKGLSDGKIVLFPNWLRSSAVALPSREVSRSAVLRRHRFPADVFLGLYSGNMGRKQGLGILLTAARQAERDPESKLHIVLAGAGAMRDEIESDLRRNPCSRLTLLPLLPEQEYQEMLQAADICLITQMSGSGSLFFPSKLLSILQHGRPVLAVADSDSELTTATREGGFGVVVPPGDSGGLVRKLEEMARNPDTLRAFTLSTVWVNKFSREQVLRDYEARLLHELV